MRLKTKEIVFTAVFIAVVMVTTTFTSIPITGKGYLNAGDVVVMGLATITPLPIAMVVGGIGSALADAAVPGAQIYILGTLVIKMIEAATAHLLYRHLPKPFNQFVPFILGATLMVILYGFYEYILTGNLNSILYTMVLNIPQGLFGAALAIVLTPILQKIKRYVI